ncbi:hypothetical protein C2E31_22110 [Rhodopirellula baltica]|nr:hypothetical protein C2E31_22110 [Rhodopirellula baltica]
MRSSLTSRQRSVLTKGNAAKLLALLAIAAPGCRSTRPSSSLVQVTEDSSAPVASIEAPQQRLATTKRMPPQSSENNSMLARARAMVMGGSNEPASAQVSSNSAATSAQLASSAAGKLAQQAGAKPSSTATATQVQNKPKIETASDPVAQQPAPGDVRPVSASDEDIKVSDGGLVSASLSDLTITDGDSKGTVEAAQPPVVTQQVASESSPSPEAPKVSRRPISQTSQPLALAAALENSLNSLPELPTTPADYQGPGPQRIGTGKPPIDDSNSDDSETAYAYVTDDASGTDAATQPVQTVSHSSNGMAPVTLMSQADEKVAVENRTDGPLGEEELYSMLLQRIVEPKENETPRDLARRQIIARYLMVLAGDPETAVESMDGFSESEREFLKNQLIGLWTIIDPDGHPSAGRRVTEALPHFRKATSYLSEATDSLELRQLEFCTEIESYGQVKPFENKRFAPGQQVILYCEVENFVATEKDGLFRTQLEGSYEIYARPATRWSARFCRPTSNVLAIACVITLSPIK